MNKAEIVDELAKELEIPKSKAVLMFDAVTNIITSCLIKTGENVSIPGFGIFSIQSREARQGRNPQTGETMQIKASKSVKFKPSKALKDSLN